MNKLQLQIQRKKDSIALKKRMLQKQMHQSKQHLSSSLLREFTILGGLIVGYMILPKKLGRFIFRSMSLISTINAVKDVVQHQLLDHTQTSDETPQVRKTPRKRRRKTKSH